MRPSFTNHYSDRYIRLVPGDSLNIFRENSLGELTHFYKTLPPSIGALSYAPGKWTGSEMIRHLSDTERIFSYRLLCIARGETQSLPGFDENEYALASQSAGLPLEEVISEFMAVRASTEMLITQLPLSAWKQEGMANGNPVSVLQLAFVMYGHMIHHRQVLEARYLPLL